LRVPEVPVREVRLKVAVTGVAGFIGSNLAARLIARGDEVAGLDDLSHGSLDNLEGLSGHPRFQFHRGSILEAADLAVIAKGRTPSFTWPRKDPALRRRPRHPS
jgi:nucleoside-diphosphate-sugar epimerase